MARARHPKKEIEDELQRGERLGWKIDIGGSHCWGKAKCPYHDKSCRNGERCTVSISSTPRNAGAHADQLRRVWENCTGSCKPTTKPDPKTD